MVACSGCRSSVVSCPRCDERMCPDHMAIEGETCSECALAYYEGVDRLHLNVWFLAGFAVPWALYVALFDRLPEWSARSGGFRSITTGVPALDVLIMFVVMAVFAGKAAMGLRRWVHRRMFMARRPLPRASLHH